MNKIITRISHAIGISHFNGKLSYSRSTQRIIHTHAHIHISIWKKREKLLFFPKRLQKMRIFLSNLHRWNASTADGTIFEIGRHKYGSINIFPNGFHLDFYEIIIKGNIGRVVCCDVRQFIRIKAIQISGAENFCTDCIHKKPKSWTHFFGHCKLHCCSKC